jgi:hypothetical protein
MIAPTPPFICEGGESPGPSVKPPFGAQIMAFALMVTQCVPFPERLYGTLP